MMINFNRKGASDLLRGALISYIIFFIFLGTLISYGAGGFITSDVPSEPPIPPMPSGEWFTDLVTGVGYAGENLGYFIDLMTMSADLQAFTSIVMIPFLLIVFMFIIETVRGN